MMASSFSRLIERLCYKNLAFTVLEERGFDGKNKNIDTISRLTGKVEHLDADLKNAEERAGAVNNQLETQTILCKDREKQVHQLQEEVSFLPR